MQKKTQNSISSVLRGNLSLVIVIGMCIGQNQDHWRKVLLYELPTAA